MKTKKDEKTKFNMNSAKEIFEKSKGEIKKFTKGITQYRKDKAMKLFRSGMRLFKLGEEDAALKDLKKALMINTRSNKAIHKEHIAHSIAQIYEHIGDDHNQIKYYSVSVSIDSLFYEGWSDKGKKYLELGKLKRFNVEKPLRGRKMNKLIDRKSLYKEALYCFQKAAKADPINPEAPYYIGFTYNLLKDSKNAVEMFDEVLEIDDNFKNIEKSELFDKVKNEPKEVVDVCSKCNAKLKQGDSFCSECGKEVKEKE
tara:strand:+ start:393 stop:1160 length:768 start_codon:yes stop_codon:yes gene_type:complete